MKMTDDVEAVMGGVRMGVNVDIKRTDGKSICQVVDGAMMILCISTECEYLMPASCLTSSIRHPLPKIANESLLASCRLLKHA